MEEKRHPPTPKRLLDARKRGEVAFSPDVSSTADFVIVVVLLWLASDALWQTLHALWRQATDGAVLRDPGSHLSGLMQHAMSVLVWSGLLLGGAALVGALAGSLAQVGPLAAWGRLKPDAGRLNPAEGLKRIFSTRNFVNLLKMLLKTLLLAALMYVLLRGSVGTALSLGHVSPAATLAVSGRLTLVMFAWSAVIYVVMAAVDFVHQRHEFRKQLRMSIDDLRREHKEAEGDPLNASRRRAEHFEQVYWSLGDRVRLAAAVIHSSRVAVALQYVGENDLPRVIARGEGEVAQQLLRHAREALVPLAFDPSLAERLHEEVAQDKAIARSLFEPVARLLRWAQGTE